MRIPLITDTDSRDGSSNKDERLTNVLVEIDSEKMACVRPALTLFGTATGNGNGIVCFGGTLVSVFGANIGVPVTDVIDVSETLSTISGYYIFSGVELSNGLFVLCDGMASGTGETGNIFTTSDFSTYTKKLSDYQYYLGRVITNGSIAVCSYADDLDAENYGVITVNTSGTTAFTDINGYTLDPRCYGNGVFVALTSNLKLATSSNGTSWSEGTYSFSYTDLFNDILWNGITYCAFYSIAADTYLYARTSTDLETWGPPIQIVDLSLAGGAGSTCVTVARGYFVVVSGNSVMRSDNGISWNTYTPFEFDFESKAVAYNQSSNKLCAVGSTAAFGEPHARYFSFDGGQSWTPDNGTYLTPSADTYTGIVPYGTAFATFRNEATNNVQVLTGVGFGITNIDAIQDNKVDFAQIP